MTTASSAILLAASMPPAAPLPPRRILLFWLPLWATWLMMAVEGPFVAAVIARLAEPTYNLAAYGVAYSFALIVESPVIMMMTASTALVRDARSLVLLRRFTYLLNAAITAAMLVLLVPPVFHFVAEGLVDLPSEVARRTYLATAIFLPWPAAIGYRRFYQGILIRHRLTRRVAYGTVARLVTMAGTALGLYSAGGFEGAWVGAAALSAGVCAEAVASRLMARAPLAGLRANGGTETSAALSMGWIARFYFPLALTSMLTLGIQPLVTFFVGHSRQAVESLAVLPVIIGLVFVFRSLGLAFQEVAVALIGEHHENRRQLVRFATVLALAAGGGLSVVAWTPLASLWFGSISGLAHDLVAFAIVPTRIAAVLPALTVVLSFQRAMLVNHGATRYVTWATAAEVVGVAAVVVLAVVGFDAVGAVAAAAALLVGRLGANVYLVSPLRRLRRERAGRALQAA